MTKSDATPMAMPTLEQARAWLDRWDRQQTTYIPDREARFDVIIDVVEQVVERPDPLIVDLGVGPGSLAVRLLRRLPEAQVVGVDADPLLLGLAEAAYPDIELRLMEADLRTDEWFAALDVERAPDAFVSTTALHWMDRGPLSRVLQTCARVIAPGGVFVNGDHLGEGDDAARMNELETALAAARASRLGTDVGEDWAAWWEAVEAAPELAGLVARRAGGFDHTVTDRPTVHTWIADLLAAGFAQAGQVWQYGDDRVVVALA